ncbi:MAG TPA: Gfo/Idh/MocA family oxidoreductase [Salinivirgaceae bacterium]|nr:Gfo/Idh/MocA family oxidoreductase [Salinivirgaceae bacterium]HQA76001.1 Gfo/Idh/MocA family oxidoreductase [Salinivirgaceae bacterium]
MKRFAMIGVAGFIAPRHLKAIKDTNNQLVAALDPFDSVGIIDSYFPECDFFVEFERFDRHVDKLRRKGEPIDYVSICSPNYLHDSHIRFALRQGATAICEKPLVLNPWNIEALIDLQKEYDKKIYTILQLRLHPAIVALKKQIESNENKVYDIDLTYITSRGKWYDYSWKGDITKSGGIATNIGIHFFDMLTWIFGKVTNSHIHLREEHKASGYLELEKANVRWFLSIDSNDLPKQVKEKGQRTYRSITISGKEIEFSDGFTDLHTETYKNILNGQGYGPEDALGSIEIVHQIRNKIITNIGEIHPIVKQKYI